MGGEVTIWVGNGLKRVKWQGRWAGFWENCIRVRDKTNNVSYAKEMIGVYRAKWPMKQPVPGAVIS